MSISLVLLFGESKTGVLASIGITLIGSIWLGLINGSVFGIGASGLWLL